jgi:hypothetical protein
MRFDVLGENAAGFVANILQLVHQHEITFLVSDSHFPFVPYIF